MVNRCSMYRHWLAVQLTNSRLRWLRIAALGVPEIVSEHILSHGPRDPLVRTYNVHAYQDEKHEALEKWAVHIRDLIEPPPESTLVHAVNLSRSLVEKRVLASSFSHCQFACRHAVESARGEVSR